MSALSDEKLREIYDSKGCHDAGLRAVADAAIAADRAAREEPVECGCFAGECESKPAVTCRMTTEIRQNTALAAAPSVSEAFADWLRREMPAGTVIGNPDWWARRIQPFLLAAAPAPSQGTTP